MHLSAYGRQVRLTARAIMANAATTMTAGGTYDVESAVTGVRCDPGAVVTTPAIGVPALLAVLVSTISVLAAVLGVAGVPALLFQYTDGLKAVPTASKGLEAGVEDVAVAASLGP